jgi:translation initiation factor 1
LKKDEIVYSYTLGETPKKFIENNNTGKYFVPDDGFLRMTLEKGNRGGKTVTIVYGFYGDIDLEKSCKEIKQKCGCGGTLKDNRIEIQGDKRDVIENYFVAKGFKIKKTGG